MTMKLLTAFLCAFSALTSAVEAAAEADGSMPPVNSPLNPSVCPRGWSPYNNHCFHYITTRMTWANAEKNCLSLGGNLASVHSDLEYHEIQKLTALHGYPQTWIGGTDAPQDKIWFWSDGSIFRYSNWCSGEPSNEPSHNCLRMNYSGAKCWDDVRCAVRLPSVCAMKMGYPQD